MAQFGQLAILLTSAITIAAAMVGIVKKDNPQWLTVSRNLMLAGAVSGVLALVVLMFLLVTHDYRVEYVRSYADRTMTPGFLVAALWGGQQGSLMFWAALQSFFGAGVALWVVKKQKDLAPLVIAFMAIIAVFFWLLVYTNSNPFNLSGEDPERGFGLNPLLRNPYMVFHPPTLFLGFAGFSVPVAFALAALITGKLDDGWLYSIRPWILFAFGFLSVGNILGMVWAYQELGWGGYWGWDPVENASLMPWITGTALVHSIVAEHRRKILRRWNIFLIAITFMLVIYGTFLTRSGVIQSVHAFADSTTGPYFLGFIASMAIGFGFLWWKRRETLKPAHTYETWSREWMFSVTNWLFLVAALFVWLATMWPLFMQIFKGEQIAVSPAFYNTWMVPVGLTLFAVLGLCTLIPWKRVSIEKVRGPIGGSLALGLVAALICAAAGGVKPELGRFMAFAPCISMGLVVFVAATTLLGMRRTLLSGSRRKFGGQLVHLAMVLMYLGFTGAGFIEEEQGSMGPGEFMTLGEYRITFMGLRSDVNYKREAIYADIEVATKEGETVVVSPSRRIYHSHPRQPTSEVAIEGSLARDLFFILGEVDGKRGRAVIKALINPLVVWIWLGGLLLVIGTIIAMIPEGGMRALLVMEADTRKKWTMPLAWLGAFIAAGIGTWLLLGFEALFVGLGAVAMAVLFTILGSTIVNFNKEA